MRSAGSTPLPPKAGRLQPDRRAGAAAGAAVGDGVPGATSGGPLWLKAARRDRVRGPAVRAARPRGARAGAGAGGGGPGPRGSCCPTADRRSASDLRRRPARGPGVRARRRRGLQRRARAPRASCSRPGCRTCARPRCRPASRRRSPPRAPSRDRVGAPAPRVATGRRAGGVAASRRAWTTTTCTRGTSSAGGASTTGATPSSPTRSRRARAARLRAARPERDGPSSGPRRVPRGFADLAPRARPSTTSSWPAAWQDCPRAHLGPAAPRRPASRARRSSPARGRCRRDAA